MAVNQFRRQQAFRQQRLRTIEFGQHRSYFALKLPHRWWLVGVDSALQSDLDVPQLEYFRHIAEHAMEPG